MLGGENSLSPMLAKVLDIAGRKGDWVTARDVQFSFSTKKRPKAETIRQWFLELQALDLGKVQGTGRQIKFIWEHCEQREQFVSPTLTDQSQVLQESQRFVSTVSTSPVFSENPQEVEEKQKKVKSCSQNSQTSSNSEPERDEAVSTPLTNCSHCSQTDHKIQINSKVKIHWAGSKRDGEIGTVVSIDSSGLATVRLHNQSLRRDLQIASVPLVKKLGLEYYLELIE